MQNTLIYFWMFLALCVGFLIPIQTASNSKIGALSNPMFATCISFTLGVLCAWIIYFARKIISPDPNSVLKDWGLVFNLPWYYFLGGTFGVIFVTVALGLVPKIGVASMLMSGLLGQMLMSICIDHYGWFGVDSIPFSGKRALGICFIICGILLLKRTV
jgi:bacterial/archaeal transporter family-2 protein